MKRDLYDITVGSAQSLFKVQDVLIKNGAFAHDKFYGHTFTADGAQHLHVLDERRHAVQSAASTAFLV